ncbi:Protein of unknown function DUF968 [uncultured Caudovirales phage]|uniref:HNHc domain containing protein n=1 Tax=uncultured Caudovirales phage TaxID=2100421 RepID=A0A6J5LVM4_9CAUD|nr:Protein of unknown function DUF968 [uncultured Caudovirales phage]
MLPRRISRKSDKAEKGRRSPAHRAWVRGHACSACGTETAIECAHVREGTDGGMGIKPSDRWTISLCKDCHAEQHRIGEGPFERHHGINMKALASEFFRNSPHRFKLESDQ